MTQHNPVDETAIREHGRFLRRFGRALLDGDVAGEDVAQDALTAAIVHEPLADGVSNLRAWLRTVARRGAGRVRRERRRRAHRERAVARPEALESTVDAAARAEIVQRVGAVVARIREPYREAILLRFVEDLSRREIAAQLGVPAATVDSRIRRGLALARSDLERTSDGEARHWSAALACALGIPVTPPPSAATVPGATSVLIASLVTMKIPLVVLVCIASVALVSNALFTSREGRAEPRPEVAPAAAPRDPVAAAEARSDNAGARSAVVPDVEDVAPTTGPSPAARGFVLDPGGAPMPNADLYAGTSAETLRRVGATDASGAFAFALEEEDRVIGAQADGYVPSALCAARTSERGLRLYLLSAGVTANVLVVDADGRPIENADVRIGRGIERDVWQPDDSVGKARAALHARTDAAGVARFDSVGPGWQRVTAMADAFAPNTAFATLRVGAPNDVEVVLEAGVLVSGIVRDASGAPVAGVRLTRGEARDRVAFTDEEGRYTLGPIDAGKLVATGPDGRRAEGRARRGPNGRARWDVVLGDEATLFGRVFDEEGEPFAGAWISAHDDTWPGWTRGTSADEDGRFALHGCPESALRVEVRAGRDDGLPLLTVDDVRTGDELELCIEAERAFVSGELVPLDAIATHRIRLQRAGSPPRKSLTGGEGAAVVPDAEGAFALEDLAPGRYQLVALGEPYGWTRIALFELAAGEMRELGEVALPSNGALVADVERPSGTPTTTASFRLEQRVDAVTLLDFEGVFPARLDLPPADYVLEVEVTPGPRREYPFRIYAGRETQLRIDLGTAVLHEIHVAGARATAGSIQLEIVQLDLAYEPTILRTEVDRIEDGAWVHELELEPGRYRITARGEDGEEATLDVPLFSSTPGRVVELDFGTESTN